MPPDPGAAFRALHRKGAPLLMPNPWDLGSARMLAGLGAQALATTSAGLAFALGLRDGARIDRDTHLAHAEAIVAAVPVPVSGDFENGYGEAPETCAETVRLAAEAGLAGIGIEDTALPGTAPYPFELAVERIRAAADAARGLGRDFVLTARADGVLTGHYDTAEALRRLRAFEAAGADCLYAPTTSDTAFQKTCCATLTRPVNILITGTFRDLHMDDLAALGASRLSLGSTLARTAAATLHDAAREMLEHGRFDALNRALPFDVLDRFLAG